MENEQECFSCGGGDFAQETRKNIERVGLSIVGTEHITDDSIIPMTYSVGITESLDKPELIIFGVPQQFAAIFINMYYQMLKEGKTFEPDIEYTEFADGYPSKFKKIGTLAYVNHLCKAYEFNVQNNHEIKALQMIYPDKDGNWPENSTDEAFLKTAIILD